MRGPLILLLILLSGIFTPELRADEPLAEKFLIEGKLADGVQALQVRLKENPNDDQARFGLGVVQFFQAFEHLGANLYKYGLRTERAVGAPREIRQLLPQNPEPQAISYGDFRHVVQTFKDDLQTAETTLAGVKREEVKLPLHVGLIQLDLFGVGRPVSAAFLFGQFDAPIPAEAVQEFAIAFDQGDVHWLRGYCHFLCALCEITLAVDAQELFNCTAHLFFEKVDSPYKFLQEEPRNLTTAARFDRPVISDVIAFIHLWRFPMKEPERMTKALTHLESMQTQAKAMWKSYQAETDDDREWIPNPRQTGVLNIPVTEEMLAAWLATLDEVGELLAGKKLLPFWRGTDAQRGVNLRRVFTEPQLIDPILWVQGTGAASYLEKGPLTKFADPETLAELNQNFGGMNFFGFAFWFN